MIKLDEFARGDSSVAVIVSRQLGVANIYYGGNGRIDAKSGSSSLVDSATTQYVKHFESASIGGSDEYLNLAKGRTLRLADRLTRHLEVAGRT